MPERTCIACRAKGAQAELVRLTRSPDGRVHPLAGRSSAGRSAYLCPSSACFEQAARRRAFTRAFAREGAIDIDPTELWTATRAFLQAEIDRLDRTTANPHQHPRRSAIARLLSRLTSEPAPSERPPRTGPSGRHRDRNVPTGKGGTSTHG